LKFFGHNFRTRNARKSIKGSKDSYYSLESNKTLSYNSGSLDRPMTSSDTAKHTPPMTSSTKNPKPKTYYFFHSNRQDFTSL